MTINGIVKTCSLSKGRLAGIDSSIKVVGDLLAEELGTRSFRKRGAGQGAVDLGQMMDFICGIEV